MDSCLQTQDTKSARVELAYPDFKSSALTSKLLLKLLCVSYCQNKMCVLSNITKPRLIKLSYGQHVKIMQYTSLTRHISFSALPIELLLHEEREMGIEPTTHGTIAVHAF